MSDPDATYGPGTARRVYDFQMERYLSGRASQSREVRLLEVEDQPYIAYRQGAIAVYTLREQIGEDPYHKLIDRQYHDNIVGVETAGRYPPRETRGPRRHASPSSPDF